MSPIFSWGIHIRNFKTVVYTVLKLCYASKRVRNRRTIAPEAICPSNFFEVGGIKTYVSPQLPLIYRKFTHNNCLSSLQAHTLREYRGANDFLGKWFQRRITKKMYRQELRFLYYAHLLMMLYISMKFHAKKKKKKKKTQNDHCQISNGKNYKTV